MMLTIELPDDLQTALEAKAQAQGISVAEFARQVLEEAVKPAGKNTKPRKLANGLLAKYGPGPSEEEIDENRREMLSGFGGFAP